MAEPGNSLSAAIGMISDIEASTNAYRFIGRIRNVPKAFAVVHKHLPLVEEIVQSIKDKLPKEEDREIRKIIMLCQPNFISLRDVFVKLQCCSQDKEGEEWETIKVYYKRMLDGMTTLRVEYLMGAILEYLNKLAAMEIFGLEAQVDRVAGVIEELKNVDPSIEDSELETGRR